MLALLFQIAHVLALAATTIILLLGLPSFSEISIDEPGLTTTS